MSKKINIILEAPVLSRSGYGKLADDIATCLIQNPLYNVKIGGIGWGTNVMRSCKTAADEAIRSRIIIGKEPVMQPELFISCNLPNNVRHLHGSKANINISAGIEVFPCYKDQIEHLNKNTMSVVLSNFAKMVWEKSGKVKVPIEVLPWSTHTDIYRMTDEQAPEVNRVMNNIPEEETFLFVGQNTHPNPFLDRKDMAGLIRIFCKAFATKDKKPALIIKSSGVNYSITDREAMLEKINFVKNTLNLSDLPNIYLLHGELSETEMNCLYNHKKVIGHISCTHGEGWGGPLLEASMSGKPVFATGWSGHLDFLPVNKSILLAGRLQPIPNECVSQFFPQGSQWFIVDDNYAISKLQSYVYDDRTRIISEAKELAAENAAKFNMDKMAYRLDKILKKVL